VYFTRGIMAHFNNEAQFMGVLGHEIGHITARHSVSQMSKQTLAQVGLIAGMIAVPQLAQLGDLAGTGLQLLFMKFSRDDESQSDQLGVEYSSRVGYDAHEMAGFFETIRRTQESAGVSIPTFLSTHPDPVDRNQRVHQLADEWQSKLNLNRRDLKVGRDSYLRMIDGIVYGEDPRQGFFEGNAYYHPELKFQFPVPAGWQKQNTPSQVIMANQDQSAAILLQLAQGRTPREAAQALVDQYKIQVVESNDINVNGLPAFYFVGDIVGEQGQQATRALVFEIPYNNLIYQFIGFSDRLVFSNHQNTFLHTMRGFNQLTDTSKLNVQPERVAIKELNRAMTFAEAMRQYNMPANRLEELAVLNGMQLEDRLPAGTLIKTVSK
jgi:predicted Zn-dependent protease